MLSHSTLCKFLYYAGDSTDLVRYSVVRKLVNSWKGSEGNALIGFDPYFTEFLETKDENKNTKGMVKKIDLKGFLQKVEGKKDNNEIKGTGISDRLKNSQEENDEDEIISEHSDDDDDDDNDDQDDDSVNPLLPGPHLNPRIEKILGNMSESQQRMWEKILNLVNYAGDSLRDIVEESKNSNGVQSSSHLKESSSYLKKSSSHSKESSSHIKPSMTSSVQLSTSSAPPLPARSSSSGNLIPIRSASFATPSSSSLQPDRLLPCISTSVPSQIISSSKIPFTPLLSSVIIPASSLASTSIPTAASTSSVSLKSLKMKNVTDSSKSRFDFSIKKRIESDIPVCYPILWPEKRNSGKRDENTLISFPSIILILVLNRLHSTAAHFAVFL